MFSAKAVAVALSLPVAAVKGVVKGRTWGHVQCWRDGNRRRKGPVLFFGALNIIVAKERAPSGSSGKAAPARRRQRAERAGSGLWMFSNPPTTDPV